LVEKTRTGCALKRDFMFSPSSENMDYFLKLLDKGYKEVYYTAPYHWSVVNPSIKKFITYTEGDVDKIICPNEKRMMAELESQIKWFKKSYSSSKSYCAEGEELLKKLKTVK
jgi:hypothetical protein